MSEIAIERHSQWPTEDGTVSATELSLQMDQTYAWALSIACNTNVVDFIVNGTNYRVLRNSDVDGILKMANDRIIKRDSELCNRLLTHRWKEAPQLLGDQ